MLPRVSAPSTQYSTIKIITIENYIGTTFKKRKIINDKTVYLQDITVSYPLSLWCKTNTRASFLCVCVHMCVSMSMSSTFRNSQHILICIFLWFSGNFCLSAM